MPPNPTSKIPCFRGFGDAAADRSSVVPIWKEQAVSDKLFSGLEASGWVRMAAATSATARGIVTELTSSMPDGQKTSKYRELRVQEAGDAPPGSMSSIVGTEAQPMHTDGAFLPEPPRYAIFHCLHPGSAGRSTRIWTLDPSRPNMGLPISFSKISWIVRPTECRAFYCPIIDVARGHQRLRYDPLCMAAISKDKHGILAIEDEIARVSLKNEIVWAHGDLLVLDNWRCLHGRAGSKFDEIPDPRTLGRWTIGGG